MAEGANNRMDVTKGERGVRKRMRCRQGHYRTGEKVDEGWRESECESCLESCESE